MTPNSRVMTEFRDAESDCGFAVIFGGRAVGDGGVLRVGCATVSFTVSTMARLPLDFERSMCTCGDLSVVFS